MIRQTLRLVLLVGLMCVVSVSVWAQALYVESIGSVEVIFVAQPLSDACSLAWPVEGQDGAFDVDALTTGSLTLVADIEAKLGNAETTPAPPVIAVVGAEQIDDLRGLLDRLLGQREVWQFPKSIPEILVEGGIDRRLGKAGSDAIVRLVLSLPRSDDWKRASIEVLAELVPDLVRTEVPGLLSRVDGDRLVLEARVDPTLADSTLRRFRLALARIGSGSGLKIDQVESARLRVAIRRRAAIEDHPSSAKNIVALWFDGGAEAVRQNLFAVDGVTLEAVEKAAEEWLPQHPGVATLILPPRVFNPRFAPPPNSFQLGNDLSVSLLERPGAGMAGLCLRPVIVPDLDGDLSATVLARLASQIRGLVNAPGWIRVRSRPPLIELATSPDDFAGLCEVLQEALTTIAADSRPIFDTGGDARRRALRLMASRLGLDSGGELSPQRLLRPGNLAIGGVATDMETAAEALDKFGVGGVSDTGGARSEAIQTSQKSREAAGGDISVVVLALEFGVGLSESEGEVVGEALRVRSQVNFPKLTSEILKPLVPGRNLVLLVLSGKVGLDELDQQIEETWSNMIKPMTEGELEGIRRRVVADIARQRSGVLGRARTCAGIAAGEISWSMASEIEMGVLSVSLETANGAIAGLSSYDLLENAGAGVLPISLNPAVEE